MERGTVLSLIRLLLTGALIAATILPACAQTGIWPSDNSPATVGGTIGVVIPPEASANSTSQPARHRDFTGKLCLNVYGFARSHVIDKNLYDHVVNIRNSCPQSIVAKVCYYQSQSCISVEVPGREQKEAILGTLPAEKTFRFEFREKF